MQGRQGLVAELQALNRRLQAGSAAAAQAEPQLENERERSHHATQVDIAIQACSHQEVPCCCNKICQALHFPRAANVTKTRLAKDLTLCLGLQAITTWYRRLLKDFNWASFLFFCMPGGQTASGRSLLDFSSPSPCCHQTFCFCQSQNQAVNMSTIKSAAGQAVFACPLHDKYLSSKP